MTEEEDVTHWEWECDETPECDFKLKLPILADDRNGNYAMEIVISHQETHGDLNGR